LPLVSDEVRVVELRPGEYSAWNALVQDSPDGGIYSQPEYLDVLCRVAGGRSRILAAMRGDEMLGGVALYERSSRFGSYVSQRLLLYYNGLVMRRWDTRYPSLQTSRNLAGLAALATHIGSLGHGSVTLHSTPTLVDVRPFLAKGWVARPSYSYIVALTDLAGQWERVEQNLRRLIKRCVDRDGLEFTDDTDFESFYRQHVLTLGRRDVGAYLPESAFREYFDLLHAKGLIRLLQARLPSGQSIASQLVLLGSNGTSHTVSAAGDPTYVKLGAQAFLRWRSFQALAELGFASNDLTDAALNPVTHFKAQLGGKLSLSLVLQSPRRPAYAAGTRLIATYRGARGRVARAARRVLGGPAK
jgi:hypothetical protein